MPWPTITREKRKKLNKEEKSREEERFFLGFCSYLPREGERVCVSRVGAGCLFLSGHRWRPPNAATCHCALPAWPAGPRVGLVPPNAREEEGNKEERIELREILGGEILGFSLMGSNKFK